MHVTNIKISPSGIRPFLTTLRARKKINIKSSSKDIMELKAKPEEMHLC